jgi:hypothetical protein
MTERMIEPVARGRSVAGETDIVRMKAGQRWRTVFWSTFVVLGLIKIYIASALLPFVDEAFYWQESRNLAWSYSDVPGMTAWLIAGGEALFGHSTFGMRALFLLLSASMPLIMMQMVARIVDPRAGWQAGVWTMILPLSGTLGVLALPDVPLTFASLVALDVFERAARDGRLRLWFLLGVALAIAWLSHYRAAILMLAGTGFLVLTSRGRRLWHLPGFWVSLVVSVLGLVPLAVFNLQHDWAALGFQLVDRHPWAFHSDALIQPLEQALVVTPVLYGLLLAVLVTIWRRRNQGSPWDLFACAAAVPLLVYFGVGLFADNQRFRVHWPLAGYFPLIALLPWIAREWSARWRRALIGTAAALAGLGTLAVLGFLFAASQPTLAAQLSSGKAFPSHFVGWREAADAVKSLIDRVDGAPPILVADNFMLAAQLDFALGGAQIVYTLDSPLNAKHGRAQQLRLWNRDEAALQQFAGKTVLLAVDSRSLRERDRAAWLASLCWRIETRERLDELTLYSGRKHYQFFTGSIPLHGTKPSHCELPASSEVQ